MNDARIDQLLDSLDTIRRDLHAAVNRVPADRRQERPAPDRWSVAEVLEHLSIVEGRVVQTLEKFVAAAPPIAKGAASTPADCTTLLAALADRTRTVIAPEPIQPVAGLDAATAMSALESARVQLKTSLTAARGRDLTGLSRQHPVLGTLNGYEWIIALAGHEARHTAQIREIASQVTAESSSPSQ